MINSSLGNSTEWSHHINLSCFYLTRFLVYSQGLMRVTFIINCALNAILSVTAVAGNISILWALTKCSSLRPPSKALLFSLALSDLAVGALVQPLYVMYKTAEINDNFALFCIAGIGFRFLSNCDCYCIG